MKPGTLSPKVTMKKFRFVSFCRYTAIFAIATLYSLSAAALAPPTVVIPPHQNASAGEADSLEAHYVRLQGTSSEETISQLYKEQFKKCETMAAAGAGPTPERMPEGEKFTKLIYDIYYSNFFTITYKMFETTGLNTECKLKRTTFKKTKLNTPYGVCDIDIKGKFASGSDGACADFGKDASMVAGMKPKNGRVMRMPPNSPDSDIILNHKCTKYSSSAPPQIIGTPVSLSFCVMKPELQLQSAAEMMIETYGIVLSSYAKVNEGITDLKAAEVLSATKISKHVFFPHHVDHDFKVNPRSLNTANKRPWLDKLPAAALEESK